MYLSSAAMTWSTTETEHSLHASTSFFVDSISQEDGRKLPPG